MSNAPNHESSPDTGTQSAVPEQPAALVGPLPFKKLDWSVPALALVVVAVFSVYASVLFDWFGGDDYVHLIWLKDAWQKPELIWRNFHSNWLEVKTTKFYRPLISVLMAIDYALWGTNGTGFHLTNILFLVASCICVFFIARTLLRAKDTNSTMSAFMAALMFGLYPSHSESVAWITGRVDTIVTTFFLLSLWCYMRWRETANRWAGIVCALSMILGLTSKEMAIMLPATFAAYEFIVDRKLDAGSAGTTSGFQRFIAKLTAAVKNTAAFWIILAAYFCVRRLSLGTFVGGYDDSLAIGNLQKFAQMWAHSLSMMLIPANRELMSSGNVYVIGWKIGLSACAVLTLVNFARDTQMRKNILFLLAWGLLSLAPVYKLFSISDDLQGSRLAYLCTVPLSILIGLAFSKIPVAKPGNSLNAQILSIALFLLLPTCGGAILMRNNSAWAQAGYTVRAIQDCLEKTYSKTTTDPQVLLLGAPDNIHGAYATRNAIDGMTKFPQLSRDIRNCLAIYGTELNIPFGHFKDSLAESGDKSRILYWDPAQERLVPVNTASLNVKTLPFDLVGDKLNQSITPVDGTCTIEKTVDGIKLIPAKGAKWQKVSVRIRPKPSCFKTDFIAVVLAPQSDRGDALADSDLYYANDIVKSIDNDHHTRAQRTPGGNVLIFPLRAQPEWALGGTADELVLRLPAKGTYIIHSLNSIASDAIMPTLSAEETGFLGTKGFLHLSPKAPRATLTYDAKSIPGASSVALEVTRVNQVFEEQNNSTPSRFAIRETPLANTSGVYDLKFESFKQNGLFQIRLWAIDKAGKRVGLAGDHMVVSVDN